VPDEKTGFTFPFGEIEELAKAMAKMARLAPDVISDMGHAAKERVFSDYSIQRAVDQTVEAVLNLTGAEDGNSTH
jgi:glycosyltransferase involved in cell wall biosynthesis